MIDFYFDTSANMGPRTKFKVVKQILDSAIHTMYLYGCFMINADMDTCEISYSIPAHSEIGKDSCDPWNSEPITASEMIKEITELTQFICNNNAHIKFEQRQCTWTKADYTAIAEGRAVFVDPAEDNNTQEEQNLMENPNKLNTIQKYNNLNEVHRNGEVGPGGAYHDYIIINAETRAHLQHIVFQRGPRKEPDSQLGILDGDLLEIVRDRLKAFQAGPYACNENAQALEHIELALMYMNRRAEERASRNVLGTTKV